MLRKAANILFVLGATLFDATSSESSPLTSGLYYVIALSCGGRFACRP